MLLYAVEVCLQARDGRPQGSSCDAETVGALPNSLQCFACACNREFSRARLRAINRRALRHAPV